MPFEGKFCRKYEPMVGKTELVNADPEMAKIRLTEPIHDSFENQYQQPTFMGYNLSLVFSSSKEGAQFEGAVGSTLYVDEVELMFEK